MTSFLSRTSSIIFPPLFAVTVLIKSSYLTGSAHDAKHALHVYYIHTVNALSEETRVYTKAYRSTWMDHNEVFAARRVKVRLWYKKRNFR
jgi:hypothetical protein